MKFNICKLDFNFKARFGTIGYELENTSEYITNDRLFSAIFIEYMNMFGLDEANKIKELAVENKFLISNTMPYVGKEIFIKKPLLRFNDQEFYKKNQTFFDNNRKKLKSVKYLSLKGFKKLINGEHFSITDIEDEIYKNELISENIKTDYSQKVKINVGKDCEPYRVKELFFKKESGFYFIYKIPKEFENKFKKVIKFLGISGIGTDISTGSGNFEPIFEEINIETKENNRFVILGDYIPQKDEIQKLKNNKNIIYTLIKKSGWIFNTDNRKKISFAFENGSVFDFNPIGNVFNCSSNNNPVWRYSKPIVIPMI